LLDSTRGRFLTFGLMYISEGIPYGFSTIAMVAFMRKAGLSLEQIGIFVAALLLPWAFKWAWAPLIDLVKLRRFGGRKAWIVFCTTMMIATLLLTAALDLIVEFRLLLVVIVLNNIFCATQDVAIDSLAVSTLKEDERGRGNGFMFGGQFLGIALGGGGAIFVYGSWGFNASLAYVSALLFLNLMFIVFFVNDPDVAESESTPAPDVLREFVISTQKFAKELYSSFMKSGNAPKWGLVYALLPFASLALAYATLSTIQVDYGLTDNQVASLMVYNTIAGGIGCLVGGALGDKFGIRKMLGVTCLLTAIPTLVLATQISLVGLVSVSALVFYGAIILHGLFFGMAFALSVAVFMGMTNPAVAATQFTAFMAMKNVTLSYSNYWQGVVAERVDYAMVLYIDAVLLLIPLLILPFLKSREEELQSKHELTQLAPDPAAAK
jgi:PAT family beta-lactamase induction signal transducer AmpG